MSYLMTCDECDRLQPEGGVYCTDCGVRLQRTSVVAALTYIVTFLGTCAFLVASVLVITFVIGLENPLLGVSLFTGVIIVIGVLWSVVGWVLRRSGHAPS